jgi:N-hydroxyarylamine O-acetyltransferase
MIANNFNLQQYLDRIGYLDNPQPNILCVAEIMKKQLRSVPFENLDVQAGKIVSLDPDHIVKKIVDEQRGGYCYEVNGLFAMALEAMGIAYHFVAARPMFYPVRRPKTHMALVVMLADKKWLCDLGFGSYGIREPIALDQLDTDIHQDNDKFRLSKTSEDNFLLQALVDGEWKNQYEFNLTPQEWIDFSPANYLNSTHPDAVFVQKYLVILHTNGGRKILFGNSFKVIEQGVSTSTELDQNEIPDVLWREFILKYSY